MAGRANARHISWIVDKGSDFPQGLPAIIGSWGTSVVYRTDLSRLTTRAWNGYGPDEHRNFKYLTPKLRLDENSLSDSQLASNAFHMVCSPVRCISLATGLELRRKSLDPQPSSRHRIVFEPIPERALPSEMDNLKLSMRLVDILSPNAEELAGFFRDTGVQTQSEMADLILYSGIGMDGKGALIVREGKDGATVYTREWSVHLPAYHTAVSANMVKDPTGGGNAYLGALAMGLSRKVDPDFGVLDEALATTLNGLQQFDSCARTLLYAAIYASVAAGYVIEQAGMPFLSVSEGRKDELWNGECFASRIGKYIARERQTITGSLRLK